MTASGVTPWPPQPRPARPSPRTGPAGRRRPRSRAGAPGAPRRTSVSDQPVCGASAAAHSAEPGGEHRAGRSSSPGAIPAHCEPWPGNTNTVLPGRPPRAAPVTTRRGCPPRPGGQPGQQVAAVGGDDHRPVLERRPGGGQRVTATSAGSRPGRAGQVPAAAGAAWARSARPGPGRDRPGSPAPPGSSAGCGPPARPRRARRASGGGGRLLEDDVGVGAADAERGDPGAARAAASGQGRARSAAGPRRRPSRRAGWARRRAGCAGSVPVLHGQHHLDDAGDAGGGLGVADVGLDRAQPQRLAGRPVLAVGGQQGLGLDRVAERGAGAVRLDRVDVGGGQPGAGQRRADDPLLGRAVGRGQPVAAPSWLTARAADDGQDRVAVAPGVGQPLQQQQPGALGPAGAVGGGGERLAPAVGGQAALAGELDEGRRGWPSR